MARARQVRAAAAALVALGAGCAEQLPDVRTIEKTRVLAVRVEVTGPIVPEDAPEAGTRCQALPFETVTLTPFVVDPRGPLDPQDVDPLWIACQLNPSQGLFGCIQEAFPLEPADLPACEPPSPDDLDGPELPSAVSPCRIGRGDVAQLVVPLDSSVFVGGDIEVTMIGSTPGGTSTDTCAQVLLAGDHRVPDDCVLAVQRLALGPRERLLLLAHELGLDLGDLPMPDPETVPDFDRNPRIHAFEVAFVAADGSAENRRTVDRGDTVPARLGDTLRVEVAVPPADLQGFLVPVEGGEPDEQTETIEGDFFRTFGGLLAGSFDDPEGFTEWSLAPEDLDGPERPEGDRATMFLTLRDDRTGVDWWWFHVGVE
jgi:hypothetical protein